LLDGRFGVVVGVLLAGVEGCPRIDDHQTGAALLDGTAHPLVHPGLDRLLGPAARSVGQRERAGRLHQPDLPTIKDVGDLGTETPGALEHLPPLRGHPRRRFTMEEQDPLGSDHLQRPEQVAPTTTTRAAR